MDDFEILLRPWNFLFQVSSQYSIHVCTLVSSSHANLLEQKKVLTKEKSWTPTGLVWFTNMASVSLFWITNMAAMHDVMCMRSVHHFTVVCLVTWPLNGNKAAGDLVSIQTSLLLLCKLRCFNAPLFTFSAKSRAVWIKARSTPASLAFIGQVTEHTDNCGLAYNIEIGQFRYYIKIQPKTRPWHEVPENTCNYRVCGGSKEFLALSKT